MQPGGGEEAAAEAAGVVLQPCADPQLPPSASGGLMVFYELGAAAEIEVGEEEAEVAGGESTASLEELELEVEEEEVAAAAASGEAAAGGECKSCTYEGCSETTTQVVKQRKPWMCKRHRNKIYKDKYKRKKSDQALGGGGTTAAGSGPRAEVRQGRGGLGRVTLECCAVPGSRGFPGKPGSVRRPEEREEVQGRPTARACSCLPEQTPFVFSSDINCGSLQLNQKIPSKEIPLEDASLAAWLFFLAVGKSRSKRCQTCFSAGAEMWRFKVAKAFGYQVYKNQLCRFFRMLFGY